jgi:FKBP-type peptidyl-prolyl cis-trans isomerase
MDSNLKPDESKQPYSVTIGTRSVIQGWDEGLVGTKEGMVRKLNVPWSMAYGAEGSQTIPPKTDLNFTMKIMRVFKAGKESQINAEDIKVGTGPEVKLTSTIKFHYKSALLNGKVFDDQSKGIESEVSQLVPGFKEAILGMKPGGQRKIAVPPDAPNPTGQVPPGQAYEITVTIDEVK